MKKFEIYRYDIEIPYRKRAEVKEGCCLLAQDCNPEKIASFDSKEEALEEIKKYKTDVALMSGGAGHYYHIEEYAVEENEYDEDGDFVNGTDYWAFSKIEEIPE